MAITVGSNNSVLAQKSFTISYWIIEEESNETNFQGSVYTLNGIMKK